MKEFFITLFTHRKIITNLKNEIVKLRQKLVEKQQVIDKTNLYWKRKLYATTSKRKS